MFRGTAGLSEAEERALVEEAGRIAAEGGAWSPDAEALREVVLAVKRAASAEHREAQGRGIAEARKRGVKLGRPRKKRPEGYASLVAEIGAGRATRIEAARELGVSCETLRKWMAADAEAARAS